MENLPVEITTEILSRLPAESILRCKAVRKLWYVLLTNPNFVAKHLANQYQSNNKLVLLKRRQSCHEILTDQKMCFLSNDNVYEPEFVDLPCLFEHYGLELIGHCDGLIALSDGKEGIIVCNPATREFRTLPNSSLGPLQYQDVATIDDEGRLTFSCKARNHFIGFGYDFKLDDYKIVRVITFTSYNENGRAKPIDRTEVFCIRADSCWREIDATPDSSVAMNLEVDIMEPCIDGVFYWRAKEDTTNQNVLISFHVADEIFSKIPMLRLECFDDYHTRVSVGVYNNSIALYICPCPSRDCIDIWVMREFGVKESWSKQLTIKPFMGVRHLGFWNGSLQKFLYVNRKGQLAVYDRVTRISKMLPLTGEMYSWTAVPYMKTIVSVKSREDIASSCEKFHP